jgi:hypothetical protein
MDVAKYSVRNRSAYSSSLCVYAPWSMTHGPWLAKAQRLHTGIGVIYYTAPYVNAHTNNNMKNQVRMQCQYHGLCVSHYSILTSGSQLLVNILWNEQVYIYYEANHTSYNSKYRTSLLTVSSEPWASMMIAAWLCATSPIPILVTDNLPAYALEYSYYFTNR